MLFFGELDKQTYFIKVNHFQFAMRALMLRNVAETWMRLERLVARNEQEQ